ncbi:MAG: hypothetical protein Q7U04_10395 [Bacteriovorax sp.]|nr:hypothetical protein [Bacteriovorax sp.]
MRILSTFLLLAFLNGHILMAAEVSDPVTKPESDISSSSKKMLRKAERKVRDESCELTEDKAKCEIEKAEHQKANAEDKIDTKKRKMDKATKEYESELNKKGKKNN